jgi:small subunit ribosomal protein S6
MKNYELLYILPGTLSEDEAAPLAEKVNSVLSESGATEVVINDLGKNRLAYPIKNIRYGYFRLVRFQAEPAVVEVIKGKLDLLAEVLRYFVKTYNPLKEKETRIQYPVSRTEKIAAEREGHQPVKGAPTESGPVVKKTKEKKPAEKVSLEEIDKQLDEILGNEIAGV